MMPVLLMMALVASDLSADLTPLQFLMAVVLSVILLIFISFLDGAFDDL
jgi:hypothetical protein